jgi:hypothetical protein
MIERPSLRAVMPSSSTTNGAIELPIDLREWAQSGTTSNSSRNAGVNGSAGAQQHDSSTTTTASAINNAPKTADAI